MAARHYAILLSAFARDTLPTYEVDRAAFTNPQPVTRSVSVGRAGRERLGGSAERHGLRASRRPPERTAARVSLSNLVSESGNAGKHTHVPDCHRSMGSATSETTEQTTWWMAAAICVVGNPRSVLRCR